MCLCLRLFWSERLYRRLTLCLGHSLLFEAELPHRERSSHRYNSLVSSPWIRLLHPLLQVCEAARLSRALACGGRERYILIGTETSIMILAMGEAPVDDRVVGANCAEVWKADAAWMLANSLVLDVRHRLWKE